MSAENPVRCAVLGAGSFGTCLAILLAERGFAVDLWARDARVVDAIAKQRRNPRYLTDFSLPASVRATGSLEEALGDKELVVSVLPSHAVREVWQRAKALLRSDALVVSASKGIEVGTGKLCSEVLMEILPARLHDRLCFLSGPSFAREIAERRPTAVALAASNENYAVAAQALISSPLFRCYTNSDVIGVELGGALKNVIAIAAGIGDGLGFGHNTRAALITRGLAEMLRLGRAKGAKAETLMGLSGLGDLTLTCTGLASRNHSLGVALGEGRSLVEILASRRSVAEGVSSSRAAAALAQRLAIEMPIVAAVEAILHRGAGIDAVVEGLLSRPFRPEAVTRN